MRPLIRFVLAVGLLFTACTSPSADITSPPAVIPLQFPPTPTSGAGANAVDAPEPSVEDEPVSQQPTAVVPQTSTPDAPDPLADPEPEQASTASIVSTQCNDASEIRSGWIDSDFASIASEGRGFPIDLLLCEDTPEVIAALECMPFRTERVFALLADLHGEQAAPLTQAPVVFCVDVTD